MTKTLKVLVNDISSVLVCTLDWVAKLDLTLEITHLTALELKRILRDLHRGKSKQIRVLIKEDE